MSNLTRSSSVVAVLLLFAGAGVLPQRTLASSLQTPGVTSTSVLVGTSLPFSGPAAAYGVIANGTRAYFNYVDAHGGVDGRQIKLDILDDGYDPARTRANVQNLVLSKGVFGLVDVLGTANNLAVRPFINQHQIPLVYPATGSSLMAHPMNRYTFAIQVTYTVEGKVLTDYAVKNLHAKKIGVFYQNDDFGKEGLNAITARARRDGASVVDAEPYELTQTDFSSQALKIKNAGADAVIIFAVPGPFITFVADAPKVGLKARILSSDVALAYVVVKALGPLAEGMYFDAYSVLPFANNPKAALYRQVMRKYGTAKSTPIDTFTEVGFGAGQVFVEGLKRAGHNLTRAGFLRALQTLRRWNDSIFGPLTYTPSSHAGLNGAYMVQVRKGNLVRISGYQYP
jgi:ABC-type branched-subunit amino acid transport system substrate-binding protein